MAIFHQYERHHALYFVTHQKIQILGDLQPTALTDDPLKPGEEKTQPH
jgi:hypothetical protein